MPWIVLASRCRRWATVWRVAALCGVLGLGGFSPGFLLSAGWQIDRRMSTQLNVLGDAAVMWQFNYAWR